MILVLTFIVYSEINEFGFNIYLIVKLAHQDSYILLVETQ